MLRQASGRIRSADQTKRGKPRFAPSYASLQESFSQCEVLRGRDFEVKRGTRYNVDGGAELFNQGCVVSGRPMFGPSALVGLPEEITGKSLRGLG